MARLARQSCSTLERHAPDASRQTRHLVVLASQEFRLFWKFKSRKHGGRPTLSIETINLIQQMAKENLLWGAERIRGELLKLDLKVATTTIQKYIRLARPHRAPSQSWSVFLNNHAPDVWACDFLPVIDFFFRQIHLFFIVELASRRIVLFNVTRSPTDAWVAQQLREGTPFGLAPRFLIRDRDSKYGESITRVAVGTSIEVLKTPYRAPKANALCERFWAMCGGNVSTTSWSWGKCICIA